MPRGIPNNPVKQTSQSKPRRSSRIRKVYLTQAPALPPAQPMGQFSPMEATGAMSSSAPSPSLRRERHFAIVTYRDGSIKGSAIAKISEDLADLGIKAIFIEHNIYDGPAIPNMVLHSVYN